VSTQPVWDDGRDDFMYPAPGLDVLPRYSTEELRDLLVERSEWADEHPDELLSTSQVFDMMMARIHR
jgi:hypothetical protein